MSGRRTAIQCYIVIIAKAGADLGISREGAYFQKNFENFVDNSAPHLLENF